MDSKALLQAPRLPAGGQAVLVENFLLERGPEPPHSGGAFVLTPSVRGHLRHLARAAAIRRYPVLLQVRGSGGG
jgi:midasin